MGYIPNLRKVREPGKGGREWAGNNRCLEAQGGCGGRMPTLHFTKGTEHGANTSCGSDKDGSEVQEAETMQRNTVVN